MSTSNIGKRIDSPRQRSIFEEMTRWQAPQGDGQGSMRCLEELKEAMNLALKRSPLSRHQVAGEMSHLLNTQITKETIDSWTADSKDRHIPAEYLPAFCAATEYDGPLEVLNRKREIFGCKGPEALRSEIHRLQEEARRFGREIKKRQRLLEFFETRMPE